MWAGKGGKRDVGPVGVRALFPLPWQALHVAPRTPLACVCLGTEERFGGGLPYKDTLPWKDTWDTSQPCAPVTGW